MNFTLCVRVWLTYLLVEVWEKTLFIISEHKLNCI